jgi:hypothetical protein
MPSIYEVLYDGETSDFYGTKAEAEHFIRLGNNEAALYRHEYTPTQDGIAALLNQIALQASGKPKRS